MSAARKRPATRDRRITRAMLGGVGGAVAGGLITVIFSVLAQQHPTSFNRGLALGGAVALPVSLLVMVLAGYREMDEYGRRLHQQAAAVGFLTLMATSGVLAMVEGHGYGRLPFWALYVAGMLGYAAAVIWLSVRGRQS
ncbi:hypothetical protein [Deinococcus sonorensis]|uniref:Uncharacterized protein n=2 Tax=Deinococcus sonorensis TaxID=309891 RepID=A0AAU7UAT9_9DEIO